MCGNKIDGLTEAPLSDEEFDAWWPFSDDDLDESEREIEADLGDLQWTPAPHLENERKRARDRVRRALSNRHEDPIGSPESPNVEPTSRFDASAADGES